MQERYLQMEKSIRVCLISFKEEKKKCQNGHFQRSMQSWN